MYLHLGGEVIVRRSEVVALCDMDNTTWSKTTRDTLSAAEKSGRLINAADDLPRSFVLCIRDGKPLIYLSQFNTATLAKR